MVTRTQMTVVWRKTSLMHGHRRFVWEAILYTGVDRHAEIPEEVKDVLKGEF